MKSYTEIEREVIKETKYYRYYLVSNYRNYAKGIKHILNSNLSIYLKTK